MTFAAAGLDRCAVTRLFVRVRDSECRSLWLPLGNSPRGPGCTRLLGGGFDGFETSVHHRAQAAQEGSELGRENVVLVPLGRCRWLERARALDHHLHAPHQRRRRGLLAAVQRWVTIEVFAAVAEVALDPAYIAR